MRHLLVLLGSVMLALSASALPARAADAPSSPGFWSTPTIHGYGKIHYLKSAAFKPHPDRTYKLVFALTHGPKKPDQVNAGLDHVARAVNLYVAAGVPLDHLKIVAVAAGGATPLALDNAHYRARFHTDNPNLKLIAELRKAGVKVAVCAQAVGEHHFKYSWISPHVTVALSALTTMADFQQEGYALIPM